MLEIKLKEGEKLVVESVFDSGSFCHYTCGVQHEGEYALERLDTLLSREEIKNLEITIASKLYELLKNRDNLN